VKIKLLYGSDFWEILDSLIQSANNRIFLASAYWGEKDYLHYKSIIPKNVFYYFMSRNDSSFVPSEKCISIDNKLFHGKIYLIDNTIIIGSQNLYKPKVVKDGEYSVLFETDSFTSSLMLYQALLKIAQQANEDNEPINENFLNFYSDGCPFCGNMIADELSIIKCPEYGGGFVSEEDCFSYQGEGACKYCLPENRENMGECFCCDHSGCGFGISINSLEFIYHTFGAPDAEKEERAREFLRLFNFIAKYINDEDLITLYEKLGFIGEIFDVSLENLEWQIT